MPSAAEQSRSAGARTQPLLDLFTLWNRKLHYYLGLYFLFFLWLFAFTGLLLNHGAWRFFEFWPNRKVTAYEQAIQPPPPGSDTDRAHAVMQQLGIAGEIGWPVRSGSGQLNFRVSRPGRTFEIRADLERSRAAVERTEINMWGTIRVLHTFTGVRIGDPREQRDWILTAVWAASMGALAIGVMVMVLGSYYMWFGLKSKRKPGLIALALGMAACGWFVFGLRWAYP